MQLCWTSLIGMDQVTHPLPYVLLQDTACGLLSSALVCLQYVALVLQNNLQQTGFRISQPLLLHQLDDTSCHLCITLMQFVFSKAHLYIYLANHTLGMVS